MSSAYETASPSARLLNHQPALPWTTGVPSPPRIVVPPPAFTSQPFNPHTINKHHPIIQDSSPHINNNNISFNQSTTTDHSVVSSSVNDWSYACRRQAQQILPHLYLGPLAAAKDVTYLRKENITLLLAVRASTTARAQLVSAANQVRQHPDLASKIRIEYVDVAGNQELISSFPIASNLITEHLYKFTPPDFQRFTSDSHDQNRNNNNNNNNNRIQVIPPNPGKTLIYCESGNERSATVAAAYVMQYASCDAVEAIQVIQGRRFCVCFDDSLKNLLLAYDPICRARAQISQQQQQQSQFDDQTRNNQGQQITNGDGSINHDNQHNNDNNANNTPVTTTASNNNITSSTNGNTVQSHRRAKRTVEETYDNDEMDDIMVDAARFESRDAVAPFRDASDLSMILGDE